MGVSETASSPPIPYVALGPRGELYVFEETASFQRGKLLAVVNGFFAKLVAYDRLGGRWRVKEVVAPYPVTRWTKFLANTFFNPRVHVELRWERVAGYEYPEFQRAVQAAVGRDDDVLTQFISKQRLEKVVSLSGSYDQLVAKLHKYRVA